MTLAWYFYVEKQLLGQPNHCNFGWSSVLLLDCLKELERQRYQVLKHATKSALLRYVHYLYSSWCRSSQVKSKVIVYVYANVFLDLDLAQFFGLLSLKFWFKSKPMEITDRTDKFIFRAKCVQFRTDNNFLLPVTSQPLETFMKLVKNDVKREFQGSNIIHPKMSNGELQALTELANDHGLVIKPYDIRVIEVYEILRKDPKPEIEKRLSDLLWKALQDGLIDKELFEFLLVKHLDSIDMNILQIKGNKYTSGCSLCRIMNIMGEIYQRMLHIDWCKLPTATNHSSDFSSGNMKAELSPSAWKDFQKIYLRVRDWFQELSAACSNPVPKDWKQTLLLCILCSVFSSIAGASLHIWLSQTLQYGSSFTFVLALTTAIIICIVLVLIHPVRCILTMIIPTLGTKQGRRLLLSTCFMFMAVEILPNIFRNLKNIFHIIRCISQHSAERILDSTRTFQNMTVELSNAVKKTTDVMAQLQLKTPLEVNFFADINTQEISNQISIVGNNMKNDFETVELVFKDLILLSNRVFAGCFVLYVLFSSSSYLRNYLTDIRFDNKYITRQLMEMAQKYNITDKGSSLGLIKATGLKMSGKEFGSILFRLLVTLVFALLSALIIAMDHIVYQLVKEFGKWGGNLPAMEVTFFMRYNAYVSFSIFSKEITLSDVSFPLSLIFFPDHCIQQASPPDPSVITLIIVIYCILFVVVFLEMYAQRLCRKIAAMFYQAREEERILYLCNQILRNS
ncbi:osteoclast stimulatory transmembrane protein-like [Dendropsophus ebraccatus]|uniref:osteoclast stimulatory transmembrane protein-like n=1 Tax=Dendropsophus ebraccatus TaxID=150705 RepID=UPI0038313B4C